MAPIEMNADIEVDFRGDHIRIEHGSGFEITAEGMGAFWERLGEICRQYACDRVLATGPAPTRKLDTVGAFRSGVKAAEVYPNLWLALCFDGYKPDEMSELFVTAARNRGVRVKFFSSEETARRWLGVSGS